MKLPPQIRESFLVQLAPDSETCNLVTVWRIRDALEEYRDSVDTPGGGLLFRSVGVEPELALFDVRAHANSDIFLGRTALV
jgi:hypothetical protein